MVTFSVAGRGIEPLGSGRRARPPTMALPVEVLRGGSFGFGEPPSATVRSRRSSLASNAD